MRKNRALRATAIIIFSWVGLRSSFLLLSSEADISQLPIRQAEMDSVTNQAMVADDMIRDQTINLPTRRQVTKKPAILPAAFEPGKQLLEKAHVAKDQVPLTAPLPLKPAQSEPSVYKKELRSTEARPRYATPNQSWLLDPSVSAWAIIRPASTGAVLATNGQLGASQIGVRIQQPFLRSGTRPRLAVNLRVSTPLDQKSGSEAGIGFSGRPASGVPIELIVERRVGLDRGGRNAFAVIAAGGFDDKIVSTKAGISGYAQAGVVGFSRKDGFIDGAVRIEQTVLDQSHTELRIGGGLWGAAQPGVSRLDTGPILAIKQNLGSINLRISAEYRWRILGEARPASGPALSIGADF
jgi:hypothetical protein